MKTKDCKACGVPEEDCGNTEHGVGMLPCCDLCNHAPHEVADFFEDDMDDEQ